MAFCTKIVQKLKAADGIGFICSARCCSTKLAAEPPVDEEFRVFDVRTGKTKEQKRSEKYIRLPPLPPREKIMPPDQDWPSVWPGPRTFHPASVPLPVRQGYSRNSNVPCPSKYANTELMKLPNFLHLTPPAIKRHCEALKRFCTPWPKGLETDEQVKKYFPLEVITNDYCFSSPKIRDPKARVVTFKFPLSAIVFNKHAKDKIRRLLGNRINPETEEVTLVTDRCPLRKQNYDYNQYLLLALFYESSNVEPWEAEKCEDDMEYYDWERNPSKQAYLAIEYWPTPLKELEQDKIMLENDEKAQEYKAAVTDLFNKGESIETLFKYKEAVKKVVF